MARRKTTTSKTEKPSAKPTALPSRRRRPASGVFQTFTAEELATAVDAEWTRLSEEADEAWFVLSA